MSFLPSARMSRRSLHLSIESLEARQMMTVNPWLSAAAVEPVGFYEPLTLIPALNSLPGAAKTIFLDFDGDFQAEWNRTDSDQTYQNVTAQSSGLSDANIRKIWETVAEDFAPFNVNVTTVQPPSFADNTALRIVIAGDMTAQLVTGSTTVALSGNTFITDDGGTTLTGNSGYAALNSFTNSEPNVVYVFAKMLSGWGTTSPEDHPRTLAALVANTASHEAGHAFGLYHHPGVDETGAASDYHVGNSVITPLMGDNTAADRTLWSHYTVGSTTFDSIQRLTTALGARPDDHPSGSWFARQLSFNSLSSFETQSTVAGIIGSTSDQDWFRFSTAGATVSLNLKTVEFANLDAKLELYKVVPTWFGSAASLIASVDGPLLYGAPFSFLGASYATSLEQGDYFVVVKSHGGYGDLGNYTLTVNQNTLMAPIGGMGIYDGGASLPSTPSGKTSPKALQDYVRSSYGAGADQSRGGGTGGVQTPAIDVAFADLAAPTQRGLANKNSAAGKARTIDAPKADAFDAVFGSSLRLSFAA